MTGHVAQILYKDSQALGSFIATTITPVTKLRLASVRAREVCVGSCAWGFLVAWEDRRKLTEGSRQEEFEKFLLDQVSKTLPSYNEIYGLHISGRKNFLHKKKEATSLIRLICMVRIDPVGRTPLTRTRWIRNPPYSERTRTKPNFPHNLNISTKLKW